MVWLQLLIDEVFFGGLNSKTSVSHNVLALSRFIGMRAPFL
jgi:hypothetical protein